MRDYRERYQKIKEKGKELNISFTQFINKEKFLYFKNHFYGNFSTIPLKDYLSIVSSDAELNEEQRYPLLSLVLERIIPLEDNNPFKEIGYRIITKLEELDTNKEQKHPLFYLPLELCLLLDPFNEASIEDTLSRYLIALFKPKQTSKEQLKGYIKQDFNKYAFLLDAYFNGGHIVNSKILEFEDLIALTINKKKSHERFLSQDTEEQKAKIINILNNENYLSVAPFNSAPEDKEPLFSNDAKEFISNLLNNLPEDTPKHEILSPFKSDFNSGNLNFIYLSISYLISNIKVLNEIKEDIKEITSIIEDANTLKAFKSVYDTLKAPKIQSSTIFKAKNGENLSLPTYYPTGEPSINIIFKAIQQYKRVSNQEDLDFIQQFKKDRLSINTIKPEIDSLKIELSKEQIENGYNTPKANQLEGNLRDKIQKYKELQDSLGTDIEGKILEYAPRGFFVIGETYYKGFSNDVNTYQISETESKVIINEHTNLIASNNTLKKYNIMTNKILAFIFCLSLKHNNYNFQISNEDIEALVLGDKYEDPLTSFKDRDNARNQIFINSLDLLSKTTLQTSYTPSDTAKRKGIKPRTRGGGSLIWYKNFNKYVEITLNPDIYSIAIKDFPIIPTSNEIYKLKPRAFITALYLYNQCAFNHKNQLKRSFDSIINNNTSYTYTLDNLKKNPSRVFAPILEDFNEMQERGIIIYYTPTLSQYEKEKMRLKINDYISFKFNIKPQKERK